MRETPALSKSVLNVNPSWCGECEWLYQQQESMSVRQRWHIMWKYCSLWYFGSGSTKWATEQQSDVSRPVTNDGNCQWWKQLLTLSWLCIYDLWSACWLLSQPKAHKHLTLCVHATVYVVNVYSNCHKSCYGRFRKTPICLVSFWWNKRKEKKLLKLQFIMIVVKTMVSW